MEMETNISVPAGILPPEYVQWQDDPDEPLGEGDIVEDVPVVIIFNPGWSDPGRTYGPPEHCYPPEGEDPEMLSISISDPDYPGSERGVEPEDLPAGVREALILECWEYQQDWD